MALFSCRTDLSLKAVAGGFILSIFANPAYAGIVNPIADSFARDGTYASRNYGSANPLEVKTEIPSYNRYAFMKFDISSVSNLSSAVLTIYGSLDTAGVSIKTEVYGVSNTSWTESGLTWNNRPSLGKFLTSFNASGMSPIAYKIDLTNYVKSEKAAGKKLITIGFYNAEASNIRLLISSREDAKKPSLALVTASSTPAPTPVPTPVATPKPATPTPTPTPVATPVPTPKPATPTPTPTPVATPKPATPTPVPTPVATPVPPSSTPVASGPQLFVSPSGNDSNSGTQAAPFKTIQKAANSAKPGTTIRVAAGTYNENIYNRTSGTASARIRFVSETKWGAKIKPSSNSEIIWRNSGHYVDIEGFEIDGTNSPAAREGIYLHGSHVSAQGNYVHHIHYTGSCTNQGAAGIIGEGYYGDVDVNVIGNRIHDVGPSGCEFDHGVYHTGEGQILNNVVYRASGAALHLWHDPRNIMMANNTVSDSRWGIIFGGGDSYGTTTTPGDYITIANNIVMRCQTAAWAGGVLGNNNKIMNNVLYGNSSDWSLAKGTPTGTINADPQFVGYQSGGGGDYHLRSTSPAINKALSTYAPASDFDGGGRNGAPDIGAYEFR